MKNQRFRENIRLVGYDYASSGAYFVTICTKNRENLFGEIKNSEMVLNDVGLLIERIWVDLSDRYQKIQIDEFIIMPNHFHGIIWINDLVGASLVGARAGTRPAPTLGDIVGGFKSLTTVGYIRQSVNNPPKLWQRNYFERIIRNDKELFAIRKYISENPLRWETDPERSVRVR